MSVRWSSSVWQNGPDDRTELIVLLALSDFANDRGSCWPSVKTIAAKARLSSPRAAQKVIRRLEARGWITVDLGNGRHGCNTYHLNPSKLDSCASEKTLSPGSPRPKDTPRPEKQKPRPERHETPSRGTPEPSITVIEPSPSMGGAETFEDFWQAYPHRGGAKKGRKLAEQKFKAAVKRGAAAPLIINAAKDYANDAQVVRGYAKDPATWLNQECWNDEIQLNGGSNAWNGTHHWDGPSRRQHGPDAALEQIARLA